MMNTPKFSLGRHMEPRSLLLVPPSRTPSAAFLSMHEGSSARKRSRVEGLSYRQYHDDGDETFGPYYTPNASMRPPPSPFTQTIESNLEKIRVLETENETKDDKIFELEKELSGNRREIINLLATLETYRTNTSDLRETVALKDEQLQSAKTLADKHQSEVSKLNRQLRETLAEFNTRFTAVEEERDRALKLVRELEETLSEERERIAVLEAKAKTWNEMENYGRIRNDQFIGTYPPGESLQDSLMELEVSPAAVLHIKHLKTLQDSLMEAFEIEKVNLDNEELLGKLKRAEEEICQLVLARNELKLKLEVAEVEASQLSVAREELKKAEDEVNHLTVARNELKLKLEQASQLSVAPDELEEANSQLIAAQEELKQAKDEVRQLSLARDQLKLKLEVAKVDSDQLMIAREELKKAEEEVNHLIVARNEWKLKLERARQLSVAQDELMEANCQLIAARDELKLKLEQAQEEASQLMIAREELKQAGGEIGQLSAARDELKLKLERAGEEASQLIAARDELREQLSTARAELEEAKSQLTAARTELQRKSEERQAQQFHQIHLEHRKEMAACIGRLEVANNSWKSSQKKLYDAELLAKKTQFELAKEREEKLQLREEMHRLQSAKFAQNSNRVRELEDATRGLIDQVEALKVERDRLQMDKRRLLIDYDFLLKRVKATETSSPARRSLSTRPRPAEFDPTERSMAEIIVDARGKSPNRDARRNRPSARYE